jgi:hypothetical protein
MKRFVVLIIAMLMICSFSAIAKTNVYNPISEKINALNMDDDVPTWAVNNYWTYDVDTLTFDIIQEAQIINLNLTVNNLKLKVISTDSDIYTLDVSGKIAGSFLYDDGVSTRLVGNLYFTSFSGIIQVRQSDLALENGKLVIRSIALLKEHPLAIKIPIPIPLTITLNLENNLPRPFIDFPLSDGKMGFVTESLVSANIKVESIVLKILNIFYPDVPPEVNFEQQVDVPELMYNATLENTTVIAGMFESYKIAFYEGLLGSVYYASVPGNLIKAEAELNIEDMINFKFNGELKEFSYP